MATPPPPAAPSKLRNALFYTGLLARQLPTLAAAAVCGPQRPNRTRGVDLFIRMFRNASQHPAMDVHQSRALLVQLRKLGAKRTAAILEHFVARRVQWTAQVDDDTVAQTSAGTGKDVLAFASALARDRSETWRVAADWIQPKELPAQGWQSDRVVLFLHGGAYCFSSAEEYHRHAGPLSLKLAQRVFVVDYRLSPEHIFPAALHDAAAAYMYLVRVEGIAPHNITVMGDSAGGNLSLALVQWLANHNHAMPGALVLLSPWSDLAHDLPSYNDNRNLDYIVPFENGPLNPVAHFVGTRDYATQVRADPYLSPVLIRDAAAWPPVYMATGTDEILHDEHILLAAALKKCGVRVALDLFEHQVHVHALFAPLSADAHACTTRIQQFLAAPWDRIALVRHARVVDGARAQWDRRWSGIVATKRLQAAEWATLDLVEEPQGKHPLSPARGGGPVVAPVGKDEVIEDAADAAEAPHGSMDQLADDLARVPLAVS